MLNVRILYIIISVGTFSLKPHIAYNQVSKDSIFVNWNRATIQSLERQESLQNDTNTRNEYTNRLEAIVNYLEIANASVVNPSSIRYAFLNTMLPGQGSDKSTFLIVEANKAAYMTVIRNYVVWLDSSKDARIEFYDYMDGKWKNTGGCYLNDLYIDFTLKSYFIKPHKGFNNNDVIVTLFVNRKIVESEYFLYGTLTKNSVIKRIIDTYKDENLYSP